MDHWTLTLIYRLCEACFALNVMQFLMAGSVRFQGLLICWMWCLQQACWSIFGDVPPFILACDVITGYILRRLGLRPLANLAIFAILPVTSICTLFEWWNNGHSVASWWISRVLVIIQMALGLPLPKLQRALGMVSHGPLYPQEVINGGR